MADRTRAVVCDDRCGCPVPCTGGAACRCYVAATTVEEAAVHTRCPCGDHCGAHACEPCARPSALGRAFCTCGPGCTCLTCAA